MLACSAGVTPYIASISAGGAPRRVARSTTSAWIASQRAEETIACVIFGTGAPCQGVGVMPSATACVLTLGLARDRGCNPVSRAHMLNLKKAARAEGSHARAKLIREASAASPSTEGIPVGDLVGFNNGARC